MQAASLRSAGIRNPQQQRTFTSRQKGCELTLMAGNVATLHAAPLPTNVASMKSMVADNWQNPDSCFDPSTDEAKSTLCGGDGVTVFYGMAKPVRAPQIGPARQP